MLSKALIAALLDMNPFDSVILLFDWLIFNPGILGLPRYVHVHPPPFMIKVVASCHRFLFIKIQYTSVLSLANLILF